jgi:glycine/D-amino acid oxidase-like deaminating enzyme/nitrite reductase/ring-hydroxylating ferredoxin subunit
MLMIARDGQHHSLWQDTSFGLNTQSAADRQPYDVIIAGGGITGITTAWVLQQAGLKCLVAESHTLGFGTTGGTTAHLNTLMDTPYSTIINNFDVDAARHIARGAEDAIRLIQSNINQYHIECGFETCEAFLFAQNKEQEDELASIADACAQVGIKTEYRNGIPVPLSFTKALAVLGQGKFHPLRYLQAMAQLFVNNGGVIKEHCRVTAVQEEDANVNVETDQGIFQARHIIYATHTPPGINLLHLRLAPYRSYAMAVKLADAETYPNDLAYDMYDPYHYYRTQQVDSDRYLIAGGEDHKTGDNDNTEASFRRLESHIRTHFNVASITHRWSSQYYEPTDGIPYIGVLPGHSDKFLVATGFGGNGMTYGTLSAQVLKSIIIKEEHPLINIFSPGRIKPIAGFKNFASHNLHVMKSLASKLFSHEHLDGFADLANDDAKVISVDGKNVGLYKDEQGGLHAVHAACTHMQCTVAWNGTEKSWDCPCHGARFAVDGTVLTGPADRDLEYINVELVEAHKA